MDVAELEDWYEQERERLETMATEALMKNDTNAQERFDRAYRKLIAAYQEKQQQVYASERRHERIQQPIARCKRACSDLAARPGMWLHRKVKEFKKWRFDRKVRRLLR